MPACPLPVGCQDPHPSLTRHLSRLALQSKPTHPQPRGPGSGEPWRIQTAEVVAMARMVPVGMDFWASRRSPERLEPAMMPGERGDSVMVGRVAALACPSWQNSSCWAPCEP